MRGAIALVKDKTFGLLDTDGKLIQSAIDGKIIQRILEIERISSNDN